MSIKIDLRIFLFGILFFLTKQIEIYAILMIFALLHELGHLCAGLALGYQVETMKITPFGFQISFKTKIEDYNQKIKKGNQLCLKRIFISSAGPFTNLIIIIFCCLLPTNLAFYQQIIYGNLLIALFNLLPIYPLDGGRILKDILQIYRGRDLAFKNIHQISKITVILLTILVSIVILYIHNIAFILILAYLWYLLFQNEKQYQSKQKISLAFYGKPWYNSNVEK